MNPHPPSTVEPSRPVEPQTNPATPGVSGPDRPGSGRRIWLWVVILVLLGVGAYYYASRSKHEQATTQPTEPAARARGRRGGGVPPVVAVKAFRGNIGVYFTGLGAVTPIYTVSLKSRVDGQLMTVYYHEGEMVHQGDPLVDIDPRPYQVQLAQAEGQLLRDQAALENARIDLTRYEQLIGRRAIPEQTLATQRALVAQDEGIIKTDQAAIDNAKLNLAYCHITAPITGRLGLRLVDPGNYIQVAAATPLAVITQVDPISVIFTLPEDQLSQVVSRTSAGARLKVSAYDREMTKVLAEGSLTTIDNQIDQTTGTVRLRATFNNANGKLFPNQFINAKLLVEQKRNVTLLPSAAVQRNARATYVYLVKPDQTVTVREVSMGTTDGENTEITAGLQPGDIAVMTGVDRLQEGSKVNVHFDDAGGPASNTEGANPGRKAAGPSSERRSRRSKE
jgi:multidrug efflux system membrane fusion protein